MAAGHPPDKLHDGRSTRRCKLGLVPQDYQVIAISPEFHGAVVGDFCSLQAAEAFANGCAKSTHLVFTLLHLPRHRDLIALHDQHSPASPSALQFGNHHLDLFQHLRIGGTEGEFVLQPTNGRCSTSGQPWDAPAGLPILWRAMPREGLAAALHRHIVWRNDGAAPRFLCTECHHTETGERATNRSRLRAVTLRLHAATEPGNGLRPNRRFIRSL